MASIRNLSRNSDTGSPASAAGAPVRPTRAVISVTPRRRLLLEDGHAATVVLIVGLALLFGLAIAVPAIRALQEALGVLS